MISQREQGQPTQNNRRIGETSSETPKFIVYKDKQPKIVCFDKIGVGIEYVNLLISATSLQCCAILQHPLQSKQSDQQINQSTGESSPNVALNLEINERLAVVDTVAPQIQASIQSKADLQNRATQQLSRGNSDKIILESYQQTHESAQQIKEQPKKQGTNGADYYRNVEKFLINHCSSWWEAQALSEIMMKYYIKNVQNIWPHSIFYFQEDLALYYLHLKNYDVDCALASILYNVDELIKMVLYLQKLQEQDCKLSTAPILLPTLALQNSNKQGQRQSSTQLEKKSNSGNEEADAIMEYQN